ncbi:MAG: fluoride efflux transporter CrcB [Calditrichales bacterium]|nr:MAG: fluoride efflux transporter CrcB [Calditrichales bacterium]
MIKLLLVGSGGFLGSISRYLVSGVLYRMLEKPVFPYGTLAVNIIGCLLIGLLGGLSEQRQILSAEVRLLLMVGFLGGFTTFSTFGYELFIFARDGQILNALMNMALHVILGFVAVWLGFVISRTI